MSLKQLVGQKTYTVWVDMLRQLVPDGRTHRLAPLVAGMLQYAANIAYEKQGDNPKEGSTAHALLKAAEAYDPAEIEALLGDIIEQMFKDAGVGFQRASSKGQNYSIAETAFYEFVHWYDMPWEA